MLLVFAFLSYNINYKVLAGSHKMGRVDTQLIGFLLLLLASVTRVKQIYQSFFINAETPLYITIFYLLGIGEGEVTQRGANLERVEMVCVSFISSAFCQSLPKTL